MPDLKTDDILKKLGQFFMTPKKILQTSPVKDKNVTDSLVDENESLDTTKKKISIFDKPADQQPEEEKMSILESMKKAMMRRKTLIKMKGFGSENTAISPQKKAEIKAAKKGEGSIVGLDTALMELADKSDKKNPEPRMSLSKGFIRSATQKNFENLLSSLSVMEK